MSARFEIVRTDAEQPWHARLIVNGRVTWWTEQYARKVGAERAVRRLAHTFTPFGVWLDAEWLSVGLDSDRMGEKQAIPVRILDERKAAGS